MIFNKINIDKPLMTIETSSEPQTKIQLFEDQLNKLRQRDIYKHSEDLAGWHLTAFGRFLYQINLLADLSKWEKRHEKVQLPWENLNEQDSTLPALSGGLAVWLTSSPEKHDIEELADQAALKLFLWEKVNKHWETESKMLDEVSNNVATLIGAWNEKCIQSDSWWTEHGAIFAHEIMKSFT